MIGFILGLGLGIVATGAFATINPLVFLQLQEWVAAKLKLGKAE